MEIEIERSRQRDRGQQESEIGQRTHTHDQIIIGGNNYEQLWLNFIQVLQLPPENFILKARSFTQFFTFKKGVMVKFIWYRRHSGSLLPKMNLNLTEGLAQTENVNAKTCLEENLTAKNKQDLILLDISAFRMEIGASYVWQKCRVKKTIFSEGGSCPKTWRVIAEENSDFPSFFSLTPLSEGISSTTTNL